MKISTLLEKEAVDLINKPSREQVSKAWPDVLYKGEKVFDIAYHDGQSRIINTLREENDRHGIDDFDFQESYLGYVPSTDYFVMGFDTWTDDEEGAFNMVSFKIENGRVNRVSLLTDHQGFMYPSGMNHIHDEHPDIIDVRLD